MESKKNDRQDNKPRMELLPLYSPAIEELCRVYEAGIEKYGRDTWQNLEDGYDRYQGAMLRHLAAHQSGEERDQETGCLHLAQVIWNAIAMTHCYLKSRDIDDYEIIIQQEELPLDRKIHLMESMLAGLKAVKYKQENEKE